ncbi:MAG: DnaD domain protein [Solibacillus sp.]|uniref:DnaD domain protein n=1 Tax=Solibacillus sp. TaxID=1909654 RepID=UPI003314CDFB
MAEIQKNYYAIIPANVRYDADLTANAKLLYGEITALCNERGYCWASNSYFAELYKVSKSTVSRWIQQLIEKGYIDSEMHYKEGSKEVESRILTIATPIRKNEYTPMQKNGEGTHKNEYTPPLKNAKDNNTSFNNTSNNKEEKGSPNPFTFYQENGFGVLSSYVSDKLNNWIDDLSEEHVIYAMQIAVENNSIRWNYVEKILKDWFNRNLKTMEAVHAARAQFEAQKGGKPNGSIPRQQGSSRVDAEERLRQQTERLKDFL